MANAQTESSANSDSSYTDRNLDFASALLDPDVPIPTGVGKAGETAPKRFSVYRNNVVVSLMEAMQAAFPSLLAIMGDDNFARVSRNFIALSPPSSPLMQHYGRAFPQFIAGFKPLAKSPFLVDVAKAETAAIKAFHAIDAPVLSPEELSTIEPDKTMELTFSRHPACEMIVSDFPVFDLFNARNIWPAPGIDLGSAQTILITRPQHECLFTQLDAGQTRFFRSLFGGEPLAAAIAEGMEMDDNFDPGQAITILLQSGSVQPIDNDGIIGE